MKTLKTLFLKKQKAISELIISMISITILIAVLILSTFTVKTVNKIIEVDQVARQLIIKLETNGSLTPTERTNAITALQDRGLTFSTENGDGIKVIDMSTGNEITHANTLAYGTVVGIKIQCRTDPISANGAFKWFGDTIFDTGKPENMTVITRTKSSIIKSSKSSS